MRLIARSLAWLSVVAALVGFFLPWARLDLREPGVLKDVQDLGVVSGLTKDLSRIAVKIRRGAETVTGELPTLADIPKTVSGAQIPQMVRQENAKVAVALLELLTRTRQQLQLKSSAVYLLPGIALLCGILLTAAGSRPLAWGIAGVCGLIAAAGFWKLLTTNTQTLFIAITIGPGLWLSLWAYVGLAAAAGLCIMPHTRRGSSGSRALD